MAFNYERSQCDRLGSADTYGIKLDNNSDAAVWLETKRMTITAKQFKRIADILSENGEEKLLGAELRLHINGILTETHPYGSIAEAVAYATDAVHTLEVDMEYRVVDRNGFVVWRRHNHNAYKDAEQHRLYMYGTWEEAGWE